MIDDVDRIMAVMAEAFDPAYGEAWNRRQVEDALIVGNCHYLLAFPEGASANGEDFPAGFCLSRTSFEEEELLLFAVAPRFRGQGIGWTLLQRFAAAAKARGAARLLLEMRQGNPAERIYIRFGFSPIGRRPNYYRSTDGSRIDAITFAHSLL